MDPIQIALIVCVVAYTLLAAVLDWRSKKLPNWMTVSALAGALLFHGVTGAMAGGVSGAATQLGHSLLGFLTGFGLLLVLWLIGGGGGGDVKFMGALGAWIGATKALMVFLVGSGLVVVGSVAVLAWSTMQREAMRTKEKYLSSDRSTPEARVKRRLLPYGVCAMFATWLVLAASVLTNSNDTSPQPDRPHAPAGAPS